MDQYSDSQISILIVGGGISGLVAALEGLRNGHKVTVLEARLTNDPHGDFFAIGPSGVRFLEHWPRLKEKFDNAAFDAVTRWSKHTGEHLYGPIPHPWHSGRIMIRPKVHEILMEEVKANDIELLCNKKAIRYFDQDGYTGVELSDGTCMTADIIIAADGIHSKSWKLITGSNNDPVSSGQSCLRAAIPTKLALENTLVKEKFGPQMNDGKDVFWFFITKNNHAIVALGKETTCWALVHPDTGGKADESWNHHMQANEALSLLIHDQNNWDEAFLALVRQTERVNDYRLMWRNPQSKTISDGGHVIQIGDAAHAFLPTSANGACQAMEDAVSLPTCIRLAGKDRLALGLQVHSKLRFERVACAQKSGFMNLEGLHQTDWGLVKQDPSILSKFGPGNWIATHDPEEYAIKSFDACASHLRNNTSFKNTNFPAGYDFEPWDIHTVMRDLKAGKSMTENGDWS